MTTPARPVFALFYYDSSHAIITHRFTKTKIAEPIKLTETDPRAIKLRALFTSTELMIAECQDYVDGDYRIIIPLSKLPIGYDLDTADWSEPWSIKQFFSDVMSLKLLYTHAVLMRSE